MVIWMMILWRFLSRRPTLMELWMNMRSARARFEDIPRQIQYVVVNHRSPRGDPHCVLCGRGLQGGYVHDLRTNLLYCDPLCLAGHATMTKRSVECLERQAS